MRWPLSAARVGDSLNAAVPPSWGLHWRQPEAVAFAALPWPSVHVIGARLDDASGVSLIAAPRARFDLDLGTLFWGGLAPARAVLVAPILTLNLDRPPFVAPQGVSAGAARAGDAAAPLGKLSLSNGTIRLISERRGLDTVINNVQGRLDGLIAGHATQFDLSAVWRDQKVEIAGAIAGVQTAATGAPRPVWFTLGSPIASVEFNGALVGAAATTAEGDFGRRSRPWPR